MSSKKKKQGDAAITRPKKALISDDLHRKRQAIIEAVMTHLDSENARPTAQVIAALALDDNLCTAFRTLMDQSGDVIAVRIPLNKGIATLKVASAELRQIVAARDSYPMDVQINTIFEHLCREGTFGQESQGGETKP